MQIKNFSKFDEEKILGFLNSFKDLYYLLEKAKQRLIDMFINRIILFDTYVDIYFNGSDDKSSQLTFTPKDINEFDSLETKKQPNPLCLD